MKETRHQFILNELEQHGVISVRDLKAKLKVTDMTIRRDLIELEDQNLLIRVHGGAHRKVKAPFNEVSHAEKSTVNVELKRQIAKKAADLIKDGDTIFLGAGTTTTMIADYLGEKKVSIVTNSLPIFEMLKEKPNLDLILIGGRYRVKTQTFVGQFANRLLKEIKVGKAFIGVNGIDGDQVTTANEEEGNGNAIILDNAIEKYLVADHTKLDSYSFYTFYHLEQIRAIVTDDLVSPEVRDRYQQYTKVL